MIWKKTRISTVRHESGDFRITEDVEIHGRPFRLESFADGADPEYFTSLYAAKRATATGPAPAPVPAPRRIRRRSCWNSTRCGRSTAWRARRPRQPRPLGTLGEGLRVR